MGDGGAYALGHLLVWTAVILINHASEISSFAILLIFFGLWLTQFWPYGGVEIGKPARPSRSPTFPPNRNVASRYFFLVEIREKLLIHYQL